MKLWHITLMLGALAIQKSGAYPGDAMPLSFERSALPLSFDRSGRSLLGTFPFNQGPHAGAEHDHAHAHEHEHVHEDLDGGAQKQIRQGAAETSNDLQIGAIADAKEKCIEKVMMIEETQYDDGIECHHSYDKRCHTTYTTDYDPQQVEECDENFVKECFIEYKNVAHNETVQICNEKPVRNCDEPGPTVCETVYESECETTYHVHEVEDDTPKCRVMLVEKCHDVTQGYSTKQECDKWPKQVCELTKENVKKFSPETQCKKKPREVCGPGPCPIVPGPKECRDQIKTVVQEVPEETCHLRAAPYCTHVTKLVPVLKPADNCVDVPKEVCVRVRTNPRKIKRPVIKKWCYVPTPESGLAEKQQQQAERIARSNIELTTSLPKDEELEAVSTLLPEVEVVPTEETPTPSSLALEIN